MDSKSFTSNDEAASNLPDLNPHIQKIAEISHIEIKELTTTMNETNAIHLNKTTEKNTIYY
jgi:hypothetical protein